MEPPKRPGGTVLNGKPFEDVFPNEQGSWKKLKLANFNFGEFSKYSQWEFSAVEDDNDSECIQLTRSLTAMISSRKTWPER